MRAIKTAMFMSLDGVVEADSDWQFAYFDAELFGWLSSSWESASTVLVGRRSFEGYRNLQQEAPDSPMLAFLAGVERYVVARSAFDPQWPDTTVVTENAVTRIQDLKQAPGKDILVLGSPTLVRWLLSVGLLDELNVVMLPIVVGSGDRLFPATDPVGLGRRSLTLQTGKTYASGAVELRYRAERT